MLIYLFKFSVGDKYSNLAEIDLRDFKGVRRKVFDLECGLHRRGRELTVNLL
jgi:hypothetical protein